MWLHIHAQGLNVLDCLLQIGLLCHVVSGIPYVSHKNKPTIICNGFTHLIFIKIKRIFGIRRVWHCFDRAWQHEHATAGYFFETRIDAKNVISVLLAIFSRKRCFASCPNSDERLLAEEKLFLHNAPPAESPYPQIISTPGKFTWNYDYWNIKEDTDQKRVIIKGMFYEIRRKENTRASIFKN